MTAHGFGRLKENRRLKVIGLLVSEMFMGLSGKRPYNWKFNPAQNSCNSHGAKYLIIG